MPEDGRELLSERDGVMTIAVEQVTYRVQNLPARLPFRYGIAVMTAVPHLLLRADCRVDGERVSGLAADSLIPKWFDKDPDKSYQQEIEAMLAVIRAAAEQAVDLGGHETPFQLWWALYSRQQTWAAGAGHPPLLWNFGASLVERAMLDAFCRARGQTIAAAIRGNSVGVQLGAIHPELVGSQPADWLPDQPLKQVQVRHTIGMVDPLVEAEIAPESRVADGLPESLEACIQAYGLRYFKIKVGGETRPDLGRLRRIAAVLAERCGSDYQFTLDGNEQFHSVAQFRAFWEQFNDDPSLESFRQHLIFVEQPLSRAVALAPETAAALLAWSDRPLIIIDESDSTLDNLRQALANGYCGTSHKNCKGIFKGLANACYLEYQRRVDSSGCYFLSGEDLLNIGPVALLQDLALMASLGIPHVERNGHHYFRGLQSFPASLQAEVLARHPDLYYRHAYDFPTLSIQDGTLTLGSVLAASFGWGGVLEWEALTPLDEWRFESLELTVANP